MTNTEVSNRLAQIYNRALNTRNRSPEPVSNRETALLLLSVNDTLMDDIKALVKELREK